METRKELKRRARENLKHYFWPAVLVGIIGAALGADTGVGVNVPSGLTATSSAGQIEKAFQGVDVQILLVVLAAVIAIVITAIVVSTVWQCLVGNVMQAGLCRYFLQSRDLGRSAGIGTLFSHFTGGAYGNTVKTMFLKDLFVTLWGLLFLIPGIIKSYQYAMVSYLLAENPQMNWKEALSTSKEMMAGNKWRLFVFQLSFLGWMILGTLLFGVGIFLVTPYIYAAETEFYLDLRGPVQIQ